MLIKLSLLGQPENINLSQFTGNNVNSFRDCQFHVNDSIREADAWFVVEEVDIRDSECVVPPGQVHFLSAEATWRPDKFLSPHMEKFLAQFSTVHSCHPVRLRNQNFSAPFLPWMVNANHDSIFSPHVRDLKYFKNMGKPTKDRPLSVFCSSQAWTPSHNLRLAFVEYLKAELGEDLAWFGNGVNPVAEKWEGLERFERTLVLENRSERGIYTEKILDPYLAMSVPIYWGAPDIEHFLPVPPAQQINISNFKDATRQIRNLIRKKVNHAENQNLLDGKHRVLNELHFLSRMVDIATTHRSEASMKRTVQLKPRESFSALENKSLKQQSTDFLYRRVVRPFRKTL
jgi:hypothetical protein